MKKLYFTILSAIFCLGANAQTLTATNHLPTLGDLYRTTDASSLSLNAGPGGAGQTWNYTSATIGTTTTTYSVVTVASTGSTGSYPSADRAVQSATNSNSFYSYTGSNYNYYGGNLQVGAFALTFTYTSPATLFQYPMSLNSSVSNTVAGNINLSGNNGTYTGFNNTIADATGTLVLTGRTFTNVIRVVNTQTLNANIIVPVVVTQKLYEYYAISVSKSPIFSIATSTIASSLGTPSTQTFVTVNADYLFVGINENTKEVSDLNLYPNPAKTNFTLSFTNANAENASCEIMNAIGQTVRKESISSEKGLVKHNVNIENLESGIYFVKVMVGNSSSVKKITIQ